MSKNAFFKTSGHRTHFREKYCLTVPLLVLVPYPSTIPIFVMAVHIHINDNIYYRCSYMYILYMYILSLFIFCALKRFETELLFYKKIDNSQSHSNNYEQNITLHHYTLPDYIKLASRVVPFEEVKLVNTSRLIGSFHPYCQHIFKQAITDI